MWGRHKKIREWLGAGIITHDVAQAIEAYEHEKKKGHFGRGLINLSVFAIVIGILSIIASNWYKIPGEVKIGVHLLLNIAVGVLAIWADKKGKDLWREGAALAFMGLTLTFIILVGQVFQLVGTVPSALAFWMIITFPFFLLMGKTYGTAVPWMIAFFTTLCIVVAEYVPKLPEIYQPYFYFGFSALLPLALMADGMIGLFQHYRPALASVSLKSGMALSALVSSAVISMWGYFNTIPDHDEYNSMHVWVIFAVGLIALASHAAFYKFYKNDGRMRLGTMFAFIGLLCATLPFLAPDFGNSLLSAILFIAYWVFIGWLAQGMGHMRIVSLAITIIAIRIYVIYVELFGSLLTTGLGLISGGIVMLALIYGARRLNARIRTKGNPNAAL